MSFHARRAVALVILVGVLCAIPATMARAADPQPPGLEAAIDRGLFFLQKQQKPDGSFDAIGPANAMTALGLLAFLSSGHTPDTGKYGLTVRNALDHLLSVNPEGGYFGRDGGRMYSHCLVTIALAEAHGTETDEAQRRRVRAVLEQTLNVILAAQNATKEPGAAGGWRYEPNSSDSDLSVTAWCMLALRAAHNAGLNVPRDPFDRATTYVWSCYRNQARGFAYQPGGEASAAMTAAALLNVLLTENPDRAQTGHALDFLARNLVRDGESHHYYSLYHTTQAAFQGGKAAWSAVWKNNSALLLASQRNDDGSWPPKRDEPGGDGKPGRVYPTAMACLTLSIPFNLLPMHQR